jgi:WD40 repeat protein
MVRSVLLSYSRHDDESFVRRLYTDLTHAGFNVWFDRESLLSRGLTFHQEIKDAIRTKVDRVVYVAGPNAAQSEYVREEWRLALDCDHVVVTPILRLGNYDQVPGELSLLHCVDFRDDSRYAGALAKLIEGLRQPNPQLGALLAVPNLPARFLGRPDLMSRVRDALLVDLQTPRVTSGADARVGIQGMGGIGKSVLASALARNREVRQSYPDGVVWIACGQHLSDDDLVKRQRDLARHLRGNDQFSSMAQGLAILRDLLAAKAVLLVLDDVWRASDVSAFDALGPRCRMLITTRDAGILHALNGVLVPVSLFTEGEALQLLADAVNMVPTELSAEAHEVVRVCGCLPLALALSGGMARKRGGDFHSVLERLRRADLDRIADRESINEQHRSIWRAMQASVEILSDDERERFAELAVFDTDGSVPEAAASTLWSYTANFDDLDSEELLINLAERSLIQLDQQVRTDGSVRRHLSLHVLLHDFTVRLAGDLRKVHQNLVNGYRQKCPGGWHSGPDDGYFFQHICHHLAEASGNWDEVVELLCDLRFVERRCRLAQVFDLIADYRVARENLPEAQEDLAKERARDEETRRWTAEIVAYARSWSERRDRLGQSDTGTAPEPTPPKQPATCRIWSEEEILAECNRIVESPTRRDRLEAFAGFLTRHCYPLLEHGNRVGFALQHAFNSEPAGHVHDISTLLLPTLREPHLLRRWTSGAIHNPKAALLRTLEGHSGAVTSVSMTPDGKRAVSGSVDGSLRLWDLDGGACLRALHGHGGTVTSISVTPDARLVVSGSDDSTLRVWDLDNGQCLRTLEGHNGSVKSVSVTPDGRRVVSGGEDTTLRVWDLDGGICLRTLGHGRRVNSTGLTPDGRRAASGSDDKMLRVWDLETGACLRTLAGCDCSTDHVVSVMPDGRRAVSQCWDNTIRVWDLDSGECSRTSKGPHFSSVSMVADGRYAVFGMGRTVRVWDLLLGDRELIFVQVNRSIEKGRLLRKLRKEVGTELRPDPEIGRFTRGWGTRLRHEGQRELPGNYDKTLWAWDMKNGACTRMLEGHSADVTSVSVTLDGRRAVSAGADKTLRVWDLESGACLAQEGTDSEVDYLNLSSDGRQAVSRYRDHTLSVWDVQSGTCLRTVESCWDPVSVTPEGTRAVAGGLSNALRVWDLTTGACARTLAGHGASVNCVRLTPDGRRAVSASDDKTLRVWDLDGGECERTLTGHSDCVGTVAITPDGRRAVSGSSDESVRVWDLESGACSFALYVHNPSLVAVSVLPDIRRAVSVTSDKLVALWDLANGNLLRALVSEFDSLPVIAADGRHVVLRNPDGSVQVWDLESEVPPTILKGHIDCVELLGVTPDGRRAASCSDGTLRVWDLENGQCLWTLFGHREPVKNASMTLDGQWLVSGSTDKTLRVWDLKSGACLRTLEGHSGSVNSVSVTPDARRAVSASDDMTLRLWDLAHGECVWTLQGHNGSVNSVSITPDGRRAASGCDDKTVKLWDLERGVCLGTLENDIHVKLVSVSPNGRRVLSGSDLKSMAVWDPEGEACMRMPGQTGCPVVSVCVTPDGRRAVVQSDLLSPQVWDLESGSYLRTLGGRGYRFVERGPNSVVVTPDGRRAVTASDDKTLQVWDLETGEPLRTLTGHSDRVHFVSVTPDSRRAASSSRDRTVRVWDLESGRCMAVHSGRACVTQIATFGNDFVLGTDDGQVLFMSLRP